MTAQTVIEEHDRVRLRPTDFTREGPGQGTVDSGGDRSGPHHPTPPHPITPSLRRDGFIIHVRVFRDTWDRAATLKIDRSEVMRRALEEAVWSHCDVDLENARRHEKEAESTLRACQVVRTTLEERAAQEAAGRALSKRVEAAIDSLRPHFEARRSLGRRANLSWVESRAGRIPELRRMEPERVLDALEAR